MSAALRVGIAFDLRSDHELADGAPDDLLEEYEPSELTVAAIADALRGAGHEVRLLGGGRRLVAALMDDPPQLVFNLCEGAGGRSREAHAAAVCELLGVPYTGSDPLTLAATLDKQVAKELVAAAGVPVPRGAVVDGAGFALDGLSCPLLAKPLAEGSSIGIRDASLLRDERELESVVARLAADYRQPVLVEEFCAGVEVTVGILGSGAGARVIGVMEIAPADDDGDFVYSLEAKRAWRERVHYHVPPRSPSLRQEAERTALAAYRKLACHDVGRVDLRAGSDGRLRFLELNALPGLGPGGDAGLGDLVLLAARSGLHYDALIVAIVDEARARWGI